MQRLRNVWTGLGLRRQIVVLGATFAMFLAILTMSRMVAAPNMALLYAGLENGSVGEVVRALEQRGVTFEVRGGSIFVDLQERDQLRLTLASEGMPANSTRGYELLDDLTGFGTTSQMFDAAYWRAKEGELARTIVANSQIAMARVHIASAGFNPFQRGVTPKASVSVTPNGNAVTPDQARAIRYLVASAVAGLAPEDVAVIDAHGALIATGEDAPPAIGGDDKAEILRDRVQRLLEARVGFGNAVVEVSVDTVTESEAIREHTFDPEGRVAISTDTEERSISSKDAGGADVTVASNLPDRADGEGEGSSSQNSESRERVNYEVSEIKREILRAPGAVKRVTVAVLVNETTSTNAAGEQESAARSSEEIAALRELVASAVGFDESRGDIITLKSMALQKIAPSGTSVDSNIMDRLNFDLMSAIQMAVLAIVTLILGLFVVRPLLSRGGAGDGPSATPTLTLPTSADEPEAAALTGEIAPNQSEVSGSEIEASVRHGLRQDDANTLPAPQADQVDRLRAMIGERQEETVEILRSWLEDTEERA